MNKQITSLLLLLLIVVFAVYTGCEQQPQMQTFEFTVGISEDGTGGGEIDSENSTANGTYDEGTTINAKAIPHEENAFVGWFDSDTGGNLISEENPYNFQLSSDVSLYGTFDDLDPPFEVGDQLTYTVGSTEFTLNYCPGGTFPSGIADDSSDTSTDFWIGETEVTYELWDLVYTWATSGTGGGIGEGAYTFAQAGTAGDGTGDTPQHPVSNFNWRTAMVWCNALTDYVNAETGTTMTYFYYTDSNLTAPIRSCDSSKTITPNTEGSQDAPYVKDNGTGFRLPYAKEWECAARYIDGTDWTPGDHASAAETVYNASPSTGQNDSVDVAVFDVNSGSSTAETKTKQPNALGLYDMSGNVFEWCFDWAEGFTDTKRGKRGGSWYDTSETLQIGYRNVGSEPWMTSDDFGIRIIKK